MNRVEIKFSLLGFGPYCKVLPNIDSLYGVGYLQKYKDIGLHL